MRERANGGLNLEFFDVAVFDAQGGFGNFVDRLGRPTPAANVIDRRRPGDHRQPGRKPSASRVIGLEQTKILGAQPDEDVLGRIHDVLFTKPVGRKSTSHHGVDQRCPCDHKGVPAALVAFCERLQVDLVEVRHLHSFSPIRPAV